MDQATAATATKSANVNITMKMNSDESDNDKTFINSPFKKKAHAVASLKPAFDKMTIQALNAMAKSLSDATIMLKNATNSLSFATSHLLSGG